MAFAVVLVMIGLFLGFLFWAIAVEPGPSPTEVTVAYELAWGRLDFPVAYALSGEELRDGMSSETFMASGKLAFVRARWTDEKARVEIDGSIRSGNRARVEARMIAPDGEMRDTVVLERRQGAWMVVSSSLHHDATKDQKVP